MIPLIQRYDFFGFLKLALDVIITKILFPSARIVRHPFYIRGRSFIKIGINFTAGVGLRLDAFPDNQQNCIKIGNNVQVNDYVHISAVESLNIGDNVLIASRVFITDHNHGLYGGLLEHSDPNLPPAKRKLSSSPVYIGDNVWIGEGAGVLPGVRVGKGSVIGCGAVVIRDIPEYCLAVGNPARVVKKYNFQTEKWEKT
ncbi:MAG: DapH/DapD/GlmU-related protein [Candidatus Omnitrophica bacterium]|nr:DapH/DapD/GlmU-related protein [Candidatus Omnitrophota bacterium]